MADTKRKVNYTDDTKQVVLYEEMLFKRPSWMSQTYWEDYEAPRIGTKVGKDWAFTYGLEYKMPKWGEDDAGEGCFSGACAI